jgi:hypothetical protein
MKSVPSLLVLLLVAVGLTSCSDKNGLQNYILDHAESVGFTSTTIPISSLKQESMQLTEKQQEAFDALDRVSVLLYRFDQNNPEEFTAEKNNIKNILKQDKYEELMSFGNRGVLKYVGSEDSMDEIVIYATDKNTGFAVGRIIGNDMTLEKFMELYQIVQQGNFSLSDFGDFSNFLTLN